MMGDRSIYKLASRYKLASKRKRKLASERQASEQKESCSSAAAKLFQSAFGSCPRGSED